MAAHQSKPEAEARSVSLEVVQYPMMAQLSPEIMRCSFWLLGKLDVRVQPEISACIFAYADVLRGCAKRWRLNILGDWGTLKLVLLMMTMRQSELQIPN
jgi:hypothetical protein